MKRRTRNSQVSVICSGSSFLISLQGILCRCKYYLLLLKRFVPADNWVARASVEIPVVRSNSFAVLIMSHEN